MATQKRRVTIELTTIVEVDGDKWYEVNHLANEAAIEQLEEKLGENSEFELTGRSVVTYA